MHDITFHYNGGNKITIYDVIEVEYKLVVTVLHTLNDSILYLKKDYESHQELEKV